MCIVTEHSQTDTSITDTNETNAVSNGDESKRGKKRQKKGFQYRKAKQEAQCLKVIDRNYRQRKEILPGIIVFSEPLQGEIILDVMLQADLFYNVIKDSLYMWASKVTTIETRALKGLNGQPSSVDDLTAIDETARRLTLSLHSMLTTLVANPNFGFYLANAGYGHLSLPALFMDILHMVFSLNRLHQHKFMDNCSIKLTINSFNRNAMYVDDWKILDKEFESTYAKFLQWGGNFNKSYNYVTRFSSISNFMQTVDMNIDDFTRTHSPHTLNVIYKDSVDKCLNVVLGHMATEKDVALGSFIRVNIRKNELVDGQFYTYAYKLPIYQLRNAMKRFILREYAGIEDTYINPVTTNMDASIQISVAQSSTNVV